MAGHKSKARLSTDEELHFAVPLARGASHIASCLRIESVRNAIIEVTEDFGRNHGKDAQRKFLFTLADKLDGRDKAEAAVAVRHLALHGALPVLAPDGQGSLRRHRQSKAVADDCVPDVTEKRRHRQAAAEQLAA